jgi:hypothetical protein
VVKVESSALRSMPKAVWRGPGMGPKAMGILGCIISTDK